MKVIDILNKVAFKEQSNFKFWVWFNNTKADEKNAAHWEYKNGYVRQYDNPEGDSFLWFINEGIYDLNDEIMIIEDKSKEEEIKELPPLEYIQDLHSGFMKFTYGGRTVGTDDDTMILAEIVNRLIREVEALKTRMDCMDKSMEEQASNWDSRVRSLNSDINRLCKDIDDKAYTNHIMKSN